MRHTRTAVSLLFALLFGCRSTSPHYVRSERPDLGQQEPRCAASPMYYMAASAQTWPSCQVTHDAIEYTIGVDTQGTVRFVETSDPKFRSSEGLHAGSTLSEVRAAGGAEPMAERGWGHFSQLPSGWFARYAGFGTGSLPNDATVVSFFKR